MTEQGARSIHDARVVINDTLEKFIASMPWADDATVQERTVIQSALSMFARALREAFDGSVNRTAQHNGIENQKNR